MKRHCLAVVFCLVSAFSLASCTTAPGTPQGREVASGPFPAEIRAVSSRRLLLSVLAVLGAVQAEVELLKGMLPRSVLGRSRGSVHLGADRDRADRPGVDGSG